MQRLYTLQAVTCAPRAATTKKMMLSKAVPLRAGLRTAPAICRCSVRRGFATSAMRANEAQPPAAPPAADPKLTSIVDSVEKLTLLEAAQLVTLLKVSLL